LDLWPNVLLVALALYGAACLGLVLARWLASSGGGSNRPFLSFLVLVENKQAVIEGFLRGLLASLNRQWDTGQYEVVVVDNGSTDDTPLIIERLARRHPVLRTVQVRRSQRVQESALEVGLFLSRSSTMVLMDIRQAAEVRHVLAAVEAIISGTKRRPGLRRPGGAGGRGPDEIRPGSNNPNEAGYDAQHQN